jgi:hypothetical protein
MASTSREPLSSPSPSSSEEARTLSKKRKKKSYAQKYQSNWEQEPEFKGWLQPSKKGITFAHCRCCNKDFVCGKSEIEKHSKGKNHLSKVKSLLKQPTLTALPSVSRANLLTTKVKTAEIKLSAFVIEHNISFNTMDHLSELIRTTFSDSEIAKNVKCNRTKTRAIITNVIGSYSSDIIIDVLQKEKFSLIVDESTDKGTIKHLALVARSFYENDAQDYFLGLIQVPIATAEALYEAITSYFEKNKINYKDNFIGFASDGANVMMGAHNSLASRLQQDIPHLFIMKCVCHSFNLCASYACEKLPRVVEDIARDVYTYLNYSFKRQTEFNEFQKFLDIKPHKILQLSQTRWLSLHSVVQRLVEQYDALILYFTNAHLSDRIIAAETILTRLRDPSIKMYLHFLNYVLPYFTKLNLEMQAENIKIDSLYDKIENTFRCIADSYLKRDYLEKTQTEDIQFRNPHNFVEIEQIYLGANVMSSIANNTHGLDEQGLLDFRKRCLEFYVESCRQIYERFKFREPEPVTLKLLKIISPQEVINKKHNSIAPLASRFPNLITNEQLNELDREWRQLRNFNFTADFENLNVKEFWLKCAKLKLGDNTVMFGTLCDFVFKMFTLPHSSATVERVFSQINLNKTKIRNRLNTETLNGIMLSKNLFKKSNCTNFEVEKELLVKFNDSMYAQADT